MWVLIPWKRIIIITNLHLVLTRRDQYLDTFCNYNCDWWAVSACSKTGSRYGKNSRAKASWIVSKHQENQCNWWARSLLSHFLKGRIVSYDFQLEVTERSRVGWPFNLCMDCIYTWLKADSQCEPVFGDMLIFLFFFTLPREDIQG